MTKKNKMLRSLITGFSTALGASILLGVCIGFWPGLAVGLLTGFSFFLIGMTT